MRGVNGSHSLARFIGNSVGRARVACERGVFRSDTRAQLFYIQAPRYARPYTKPVKLSVQSLYPAAVEICC